jgi:hypothetical protein
MLLALVHVLVALVVLVIIFYIVKLAATHFGLPPVVVQLCGLILGLVLLIYLLNVLVPGFKIP